MSKSNALPASGQEENQLTQVNIAALGVIVHAARNSFDVAQLRYLAAKFDGLAGEKEAGR